MNISVIIPCYNAAEWLPKTVGKIEDALKKAKVQKAEIIVVDDGSSDGSYERAKSLSGKYPVVAIKQKNMGRFLARKAGIDKSKYEHILLIDTRVFIDENSIAFLSEQVKKYPKKQVWNGHVNVYKKGNVIARFMDTVTNIGWRRYFSNPRTCDYGLKDFDYYPKGTGCFFVPKKALAHAMKKFMSQTTDLRNSSDDTLLIRIIAGEHRINLSPKFSCTYFARNTIKQFIPHTFNRGRFFVDGFLRKGTRFFYPLIAFLLLSAPIIVVTTLFIINFFYVATLFFVFLPVLLFIVTVSFRINIIDALSFSLLAPLFTVVYGFGIWYAALTKYRKV